MTLMRYPSGVKTTSSLKPWWREEGVSRFSFLSTVVLRDDQSSSEVRKHPLSGGRMAAGGRPQTRNHTKLEGAVRYAGLLLAPEEGFGLRPRPFFALWAKKGLFISVLAQILVIFGDQ